MHGMPARFGHPPSSASRTMPGIVGLVTKMPRQQAEAEVCKMIASVRHEPFYRSGTCADESLGIYLGWVAHENSFSDKMPLVNETGDISLIFCGNEYHEPGTPERLRANGHACEIEGPSYLVHLYEEDRAFPASLNGVFHGVVVDKTVGTATLFNDRYGMHRVSYFESKDSFYFASEAKAIPSHQAGAQSCRPQRSRGASFLCLRSGGSDDIPKHPCLAAWLSMDPAREGSRAKDYYFNPRQWEEQGLLDPELYYGKLRDSISSNLKRYFLGSRIGIALTGGLDTRAIMAWRNPSDSLSCYTFGGMYRDTQDVRVARQVANACHQPHQVITLGNEFLSRFPYYAERSLFLSEGGVDVSRSSDLYLSERAREIAPVKIVGTYASEILCESVMFKPTMPPSGLFCQEFLPHICQSQDTYGALTREHPITFAAFRQFPWYHRGIVGLEETQLSVRSPFLDNDFVQTAYCAPKAGGWNHDLRLRLIRDGNPALERIQTDRGVGGESGPLARAVARGFQEFTFKAEYAFDSGMPQWLARINHVAAPLQWDRLFLGRHKLSHFRVWYQSTLSAYVREILLDSRSLARPYLESKGVEALVKGHLQGDRNFTSQIHKLLTLELLHREFFDPK